MSQRRALGPIVVLGALIACGPRAAIGQPPVVSVAVETCGAPWASFDALAPALRVELRSVTGAADVVRASGDAAPVLWIDAPDCTEPTALRITARREGRGVERAIDVSDVPEPARARTIALVVVDVLAALGDALPPAAPRDAPSVLAAPEPSVEVVRPTREDSVAPPSVRPTVSPEDRASRGLALFLLGEAMIATAGDVFWGARAGVDLPLAPIDLLTASAALGVTSAHDESALGTIDLFVVALSLSVDASVDFGPLSLGAGLGARPGIVIASASAATDRILARNETDFVLDLAVVGRARFSIAPPLSLLLDAGIAYAARGYEARAGDARAAGLTGWLMPIRVGLAWSL